MYSKDNDQATRQKIVQLLYETVGSECLPYVESISDKIGKRSITARFLNVTKLKNIIPTAYQKSLHDTT